MSSGNVDNGLMAGLGIGSIVASFVAPVALPAIAIMVVSGALGSAATGGLVSQIGNSKSDDKKENEKSR